MLTAPLIIFTSCDDDEPADPVPNVQKVEGFSFATSSDLTVDAVASAIETTLQANEAISIVAQVDHESNAANVDLQLRPTRTIFFGNPNLGTPIMQANPLAGLDLPQKIVVYEEVDGDVVAGYNDTSYLAKRHGVDSVSTLPTIAQALSNITSGAIGEEVALDEVTDLDLAEGLVVKTSTNDFGTTYDNIIATLEGNSNITIVAELDHQANAETVGMELDSIRLIIFGNPALGSPLMNSEQSVALDLPQKMLVYTDTDGSVKVAYNSPQYVATRHHITASVAILGDINTALGVISDSGVN